MADNVQTASVGGIAPLDDDVTFHRRRVTFVAPLDDTVPEPSARPDQQEHHPVNQTLAPETSEAAEAPVDRLDDTTEDRQAETRQAETRHTEVRPVDAATPVVPRPVSIPSHRADVVLDDVVPTDAFEARPASVARHSVDTSAITLPVLAVSVPDDLPQPPERMTLDDEVLARLVEKRLEDTATIDLMAVVQAQLALREVEAARFASWEDEITRVGTDEAARALEATRLRFTGVLPVVTPGAIRQARPVVEAGHAPDADRDARPADATPTSAPVVVPSTGPRPLALDSADAPDARAAADQEALVAPTRSASDGQTVASASVPPLLRRPLALVVAATAALIVVAAVVLAFVPALAVASAVLATVAVPVATGLVGLTALASVSTRPDDATRVARRGPVGVVAGVVVGTVVGFGLLLSDLGSFAWQGFVVRAVGLTGLSTSVSVVVALLGASVVAFIVAVMITGFRSTARD
ncbi:hypothetical protein [Frigoribacterium sp. NPDC087798]|uniref:hypothetical protein n=1 Tax=Frigoribacterium sp. NPDC087798 TaxID=3363993 RepID=UPI0038135B2E